MRQRAVGPPRRGVALATARCCPTSAATKWKPTCWPTTSSRPAPAPPTRPRTSPARTKCPSPLRCTSAGERDWGRVQSMAHPAATVFRRGFLLWAWRRPIARRAFIPTGVIGNGDRAKRLECGELAPAFSACRHADRLLQSNAFAPKPGATSPPKCPICHRSPARKNDAPRCAEWVEKRNTFPASIPSRRDA